MNQYMPYQNASAELTVQKSRFIANLAPCFTIDEAKSFINSIKSQYSDATHNVPAFTVGAENSRTDFCSDDGEPSGTSGKPLLAVLRGSGIINTAIVVTRYFGGILLGTGGLVKAYSRAGQLVLEQVQKAELVPTHKCTAFIPYHLFDKINYLIASYNAVITKSVFTEQVFVELTISIDKYDEFSDRFTAIGTGSITLTIIETYDALQLIQAK